MLGSSSTAPLLMFINSSTTPSYVNCEHMGVSMSTCRSIRRSVSISGGFTDEGRGGGCSRCIRTRISDRWLAASPFPFRLGIMPYNSC
ncbi:hypothetical protein KC19_5G174300, partial [Ceratodon purpureus]